MNILGTVSELDQGATIEMHEVDARSFGGDFYRFHDGLNQGVGELIWCGKPYTFWPVDISEMKVEGDRPTRPTLRLGNHSGVVTRLCNDFDDLVGAIYTLRVTKARYLDSANFEGWRGYAVALEGDSTLTGPLPQSTRAVIIELQTPTETEAGKSASILSLVGGTPLAVSSVDGRLELHAGGKVAILAEASKGQKFTVSLSMENTAGKLTVRGHVNEAVVTLQTDAVYAEPVSMVIGGVSNQGLRVRSVATRAYGLSLQDIRAYVATGVIANPGTHYRFNLGTIRDEVTNTLLNAKQTETTTREEYYYSLYGMSRQAVERLDSIGSIYLVDWVKTNPTASIFEEFPAERFRIVRKASESPLEVAFELAPLHDVKGIKLPLKVVTENVCLHEYRGEFCRYAGPPRDINGEIINIPPDATEAKRAELLSRDDCSHDKRGCVVRFGRVLPIGCFLGAGRVGR